MRFGVAKEIITPDRPMCMIGYAEYYKKHFQAIHDDLYVRCMMLNDGETTALILAYDLLFHDLSLTDAVRRYAAEAFGVKPSSVILSYTHTHYGVAVKGYASELAEEDYESFLLEQTKRCIRKAFINSFDGTIDYGVVRADENINRRKLIDGEYIMAPNLEGEADKELSVLLVKDEKENVRIAVTNYSCHPNVLRDVMELSGEYPGRVCQLLEAEYYGAQAIFLQGCGADSRAKITAEYDHFMGRTTGDVDDMARSLAAKVIRAERRSDAFLPLPMKIRTASFAIPCPLDIMPLSFYQEDLRTNPFEALRACAEYVIENYDNLPAECMLHGGVWQLSEDLLLIYLGGEICYPTKKMLKEAFPDKRILFLGYTDSTAYVPSDQIISEGGYEHEGSIVEYRLKGTFAPGIDKLVVDAIKAAMADF